MLCFPGSSSGTKFCICQRNRIVGMVWNMGFIIQSWPHALVGVSLSKLLLYTYLVLGLKARAGRQAGRTRSK